MVIQLTCVECGRQYDHYRSCQSAERCPECQKRYMKRVYKRNRREKAKAERALQARQPPKVCPFCGTKFRGRGNYCKECVDQGFDNVHMTFGSTNGWDKKERQVVEIKDGWRGRVVLGGASARGKMDFVKKGCVL